MGVYEDKLGRVIALGINVWVAEYRFATNDEANVAGLAVTHRVPELVEHARSGRGDMVVADYGDHSRLFFGGLLDDGMVARIHRIVIELGGALDVARQPPDSALILTPQGVEEGHAPTLLTAEEIDEPAADPEAPPATQRRDAASPWWRFWE